MISFSGDTLYVNWEGNLTGVDSVQIDLTFASVPESGILALLGLGLAVIWFSRKMKMV